MLRFSPSPALLLLCALAFPQAALSASSGAPRSDKEVVGGFIADVEKVCHTKLREEIDAKQQEEGMGNALESFVAPDQYCGCISGELRKGLSAESVRAEDEVAIGRQVQSAASVCTVHRAKLMFGKNCRTWFASIPLDEDNSLTPQQEDEFIGTLCSCVSENAESITAENLAEVTSQTKVDVAHMGKLIMGEAQPGPLSLFGGRCATDMHALLLRYKPQLKNPDGPFTPAEQAKIDQVIGEVEQGCQSGVEKTRKEGRPADPSQARRWDQVTSGGYCACLGDEVRKGMTPRIARLGSEEEGGAVVTSAIQRCASRESPMPH